MTFLKLTDTNGESIYIKPDQIIVVSESKDKNGVSRTFIHYSADYTFVQESAEEVLDLIKTAQIYPEGYAPMFYTKD